MSNQKKILVIEDDLDLVEVMKTTLTSKNYKTFSARNGDEGLKKAKDIEPDLIILDVMMKFELEGFHVSYKLRQDPKLQYIPILMITSITEKTGFSFSPDTDGEFLPVDDYVEKPLGQSDLINRIEKLLKLKKDEININGKSKNH